jgi:PKD repeat protein
MKIHQSCKDFGLKLISAVVAVTVILTFDSICSAGDLLQGKVLRMHFNEGSGDTVIDWENRNDGKINGSANWTDGRYSGALYLDGQTRVTVPNADPLTQLSRPMTVAAWVNPAALGGWRNLVEMDGPGGWKVGFDDNHVVWTQYSVQDFTGQTTIVPGQWTHVATTWDGAQARIYINGQEDIASPIASSSAGLNGQFYSLAADHIKAVNQHGVTLDRIESAIAGNLWYTTHYILWWPVNAWTTAVDPNLTRLLKTMDFPNTGATFRHRDGTTLTGMSDTFYARFTGYILIPETGTYRFYVSSDDGFRLKIDGKTVVEYQNPRGYSASWKDKHFSAGVYPIELSYFEWTGNAGLKLEWTPPGGTRQVIPSTHLTQRLIDVSDTAKVPSLDIGYRRTSNSSYLQGSIDDLWIFSDVKTPAEIQRIMNKPEPQFTNVTHPANAKFNVPVDPAAQVGFSVKFSKPPADIEYYFWQLEAGTEIPTNFKRGTMPERNFRFDQPGDYTVYCKAIDVNGMESGIISIPVHAWKRPTVHDTPPQPDAVSWYDGKEGRYVGVKGQPVKLMAGGTKGSGSAEENIAEYIWDFDNDWDTIELRQTPGQIVQHTWDQAILDSAIRCKAVTNLGIESDERKTFKLKIYDLLQVDPDGPYTGRPTRPVKLAGSVNKTSYPGASFEYQWYVKPDGNFIPVTTSSDGRAEYSWVTDGDYQARFQATVTTSEGLVLTESEDVVVTVEAGRPTAMPDGPYRGGIYGGNFSPVQFQGNPPDFVEAADVGTIQDWLWYFPDTTGMALQLDGADDYIQAPAMEESAVEMWVKLNAPAQMGLYSGDADYNVFIYGPEGIDGGADFDVTYGLYVDFYGDAIAVPFNDIREGWHHIAISWDGGTELRVGLDGQFPGGYVRDAGSWVEDNQQPFTLTDTPQPDPNADTLIGKTTFSAWNIGSQHFNGIIDEVAIWNDELDADEVWEHIEDGLLGNEQSLVLYLNLEEGQGNTAQDPFRPGNIGTLVNMVQESWVIDGHPEAAHGVWNPTHAYSEAGKYTVSLRVQSEYGKWGSAETTQVKVIDGKITGYVRAADLRTPVKDAQLTLTSSHVDTDVLATIVESDPFLTATVLSSGEFAIYTQTDQNGYYIFEHIPLGSYRVIASKKEDDTIHEFETSVKLTELTLDAPNQLGVDFVDLSLFPISGRIVYSIQKNAEDVLVQDVLVEAQAVGSTNSIKSLLSTASGDATGSNYRLPLFSGNYLFIASRQGHDIRIKEDTPDYDSGTGLVTIDRARTDVDFIDHTARELTVLVEDSGGYIMPGRDVIISGENGQAEGVSVLDELEGKTKFAATLNPGKYTVTVPGGMPRGEEEEKPAEVDLTGGDQAVTMIIPVKIELQIVSEKPKLYDGPEEFLEQCGLTPQQNPEGYMYYYSPEPQAHTYKIIAMANGNPVEDFDLFVTDEISMMTEDPPEEQETQVEGTEAEYEIEAGLPKIDRKTDPPLALPKSVRFRAEKTGYKESDPLEDQVIVLGDVPVGTAARIVSIPFLNYLVLHDPPGDGSYSYLDDSMNLKGMVFGAKFVPLDVLGGVNVYPSPWTASKGLNGEKIFLPVEVDFVIFGALEIARSAIVAGLSGPFAYPLQLINMAASYGLMAAAGYQYDVSPNRHLETASGDELPDLVGPGKGDIYYGEGLTLGLQTKYRLCVSPRTDGQGNPVLDDDGKQIWDLQTHKIETYALVQDQENEYRKNQYVYTIRDIENIIKDLELSIEQATTDEEKAERTKSKTTWEDLLSKNLAYTWNKYYVGNADKIAALKQKEDTTGLTKAEQTELSNLEAAKTAIDTAEGDIFKAFKDTEGGDLSDTFETLMFSAGPAFEYSRTIAEADVRTMSMDIAIGSSGFLGTDLKNEAGFSFYGSGITVEFKAGGTGTIDTSTGLSKSWESGVENQQTVGFVLNDDDIGDNIATRVYADPVWGTPLFFQEPGSVTSDPWEPGTNKAVDVVMELIEQPDTTAPFDYHDGAHYKVRVTYSGQRELESATVDFVMYANPILNLADMTARFNGDAGPYELYLCKQAPTLDVEVSLYPPGIDQDNSEEKQYQIGIEVDSITDAPQIFRVLTLKPTFADLRAPRAIITAPYPGQRISPVLFPDTDPFDIQVVSEDADLASVQLQIRAKQPDSVWEPWRTLSGMVWEDGVDNPDVKVFDRLERDPPRREFTFKWTESEIKSLGVGEYALRAVAKDKATSPNTDIDPPDVAFLVDDSKPTVLTTLPDYQARERDRTYRGELSAIFTDDMRADDFSDRTFAVSDLLKGGQKVSGFVSYGPALRKAVFVPIVPFNPNGFYQVEIKTDVQKADGTVETGVHDLAGNPLDNAFMWTFRTTDAPFEPTWSIALRVTDGTSTDANNIAAVEYGAEDGEDERDARAVPSLTSQLRVSFLNRSVAESGEEVDLDRDIRPADGRLSHHWFFVVDNAANGSEVTIHCKPSIKLIRTERQYQVLRLIEFDAAGNVTNTIPLDPTQAPVDPATGEIGELEAYTYTNAGEASRYFRLDVQKANLVATEFQKGSSGWKFFSAPVTPQRADPFVNLGDDIDPFQMYRYDTRNSQYKIYPLDIGEVSLQTGHGYFTRLDADVEVDVGGASNLDDVTLTLEAAGWHAIGNPFILPVNIADLKVNGQSFDAAVTAELIEGTLYRWKIDADPVTNPDAYEEITNASQLSPWDGCWLKTKQADLTLTIPAPAGIATAAIDLPDSFDPPMAPPASSSSPISQFDLRLELFSSFASDVTTVLGTRRDAQVAWDIFDRSEPPILGKTVAAYFDHPDWVHGSGLYNQDYQPTLKVGEQRIWNFTVYTDRPDTEMTISWEKSIDQVPGDVMIYFRQAAQADPLAKGTTHLNSLTKGDTESSLPVDDSQSEWQDMREVRFVDLVSRSRITEFPFEVRAQRFRMSPPSDVQVTAGENQVTLRWKADHNEFIESYLIDRQNGSAEDWKESPTLEKGQPPYSSFENEQASYSPFVKGDQGGFSSRYVLRQDPDDPISEFVDTDVLEDVAYTYQISVRFRSGAELRSELFTVTTLPVIKRTALLQSYPNPFNPEVWIPYELAEEAPVSIRIYNVSGQLVRTLDLGIQPRGRYVSKEKAAYWDGQTQAGEKAASGVYFYTLQADTFSAAKKMVILK